jgi:NifU-like protein involved in Fe-S cluster formation
MKRIHQLYVILLVFIVLVSGCSMTKSNSDTIGELIDQKKYSEAIQVYEKNKKIINAEN